MRSNRIVNRQLDLEDTPSETIQTLHTTIDGLMKLCTQQDAVKNGNKPFLSKEREKEIWTLAKIVEDQLFGAI